MKGRNALVASAVRAAVFLCVVGVAVAVWTLASAATLSPQASTALPARDSAAPVTGILGAMPEEIQLIERSLTNQGTELVGDVKFITGRLAGRRVVLAQSGIGKVNAAMTATLLASQFRPREVLFSGIAGGISADLLPGDIVIAGKTAQHDFGLITDKGFEPEMEKDATGKPLPRYYPADPRLLKLAQAAAQGAVLDKIQTSQGLRQPAVRTGIVATGDVFVASRAKKEELRRVFQADAVEMEGDAVAQVCRRMRVPCLIIRSISDSADTQAFSEMAKFIHAASANSAAVVIELVKKLAAERAARTPAAR